MPLFSKSQRNALNNAYATSDDGSIPLSLLDLSELESSALITDLDARYVRLTQTGQFATAAQGALANSSLQATTDITNTIAGTAAATLVSNASTALSTANSALSTANTAFSWGNHASAGYLTSAPYLRVFQATALGGAPETFTLPVTPYAGSDVLVFVEQLPKHKEAADPPAAGNFYVTGTTVKVATTVADRVSIYYTA